ncbi:hypothetical protein ACKWTF_001056 [Chironomus riparius]
MRIAKTFMNKITMKTQCCAMDIIRKEWMLVMGIQVSFTKITARDAIRRRFLFISKTLSRFYEKNLLYVFLINVKTLGGPLQISNHELVNCTFTQFGIVSIGPKVCGLTGAAGGYVNVYKFIDWIEGIVWPNEV